MLQLRWIIDLLTHDIYFVHTNPKATVPKQNLFLRLSITLSQSSIPDPPLSPHSITARCVVLDFTCVWTANVRRINRSDWEVMYEHGTWMTTRDPISWVPAVPGRPAAFTETRRIREKKGVKSNVLDKKRNKAKSWVHLFGAWIKSECRVLLLFFTHLNS